jgi:CO/xanthine dehydrogenase Mo-binding subunit
MQSPFTVQLNVAKVLGYSLDKVRVIQAATGGGFGGKDDIPPEVCARAALVAIHTRRPAFLAHTREESISAHSKRHAYLIKYKSGATKEGKVTAAEIEIISDVGAYASHGPYVLWRSTVHSTGPYVVPNVKVDSYLVYTNKVYGGSFRGFGNPQIQFAAESQMDELADRLGMDPVDFRLKNVLKPGSLTATSQLLDHSVGIEECLSNAAEISKWKNKRNSYRNQTGVKRRGIGVGLMWHGNSTSRGAPDYSAASLIVHKDGSVRFRTGIGEIGQGTHTGELQIVAEILGVRPEMIHIDNPDTSAVPDSGPTHASRGLLRGGAAAMVAAYKVRENLNKVAAEILGCDESKVEISDARVYSNDNPSKAIDFEELARQCYERGANLSYFGYFRAPKMVFNHEDGQGEAYSNFTFAAHIAEVEVDTETGQVQVLNVTPVYDAGKAINPLLLAGQIEGAALQGMGYAIMEEINYDGGVVMNPTLQDYVIPTALDIPEIKPILIEHRFKYGPFGAKGMGEAPLIPMAAAIGNAIYNATGIRIRELPATPERVLLAIRRGNS